MLALGSFQSSTWAYDYRPYTVYLGALTAGNTTIYQPNMGYWGTPTLAPNGSIYCLPLAAAESPSGTLIQKIAKVDPGTMNTDSTNYTSATVSFIADNASGRPTIPNGPPTSTTTRRYKSKGILAPNGRLYFFPDGNTTVTTPSILSLNPNDDTWDLKSYTDIATATGATLAGMGFAGGILHSSGEWIYFIPSNNVTMRMAPRSVSGGWTNPSNASTTDDLYEVGYFTGAASRRFMFNATSPVAAGGEATFKYPIGSDGSRLGGVANSTSTSTPVQTGYNLRIGSGIMHPNGKIYMGGGATRWIFIMDPNNWGTITEIYSKTSLYTNTVSANTQYLRFVLEKKKTNQDPTTLKIYLPSTSFNANQPTTPSTTLGDLELDPTNDSLSNTGILKGVPIANATSGIINVTPVIMSNGVTIQTYPAAVNGGIINIIATGDDYGSNVKKALTGESFQSNNYMLTGFGGGEKLYNNDAIYNTNGNYSTTGRSGTSIPLGGSLKGKTIVIGGDNPAGGRTRNLSGEIISIKGYAPGVTFFNHTSDDDDIYTIPTDLSTLGTSLYNSYFNTPF